VTLLTKVTKYGQTDYQEWDQTELSAGDIIGVLESLGRYARHITIESIGGDTVIRFNVSKKIYKNQYEVGNAVLFGPDAPFYTSPIMAEEVELPKTDITVGANTTQKWEREITVHDIKIVSMAPTLRIIVS
jgi:hypothetical protein